MLYADEDGRKGEGPEVLGTPSHGLDGPAKQPKQCTDRKLNNSTFQSECDALPLDC